MIRYPESGKKFIPDQDPGSRGKKAPDPGSATLLFPKRINLVYLALFFVLF
jgi:hypothetical protein